MTEPDYRAQGPFDGFGPEDLLGCYARGVFPMAETRDDPRVFIIEPEQRGVIPLDAFHIPTRLRRTVRNEPFEVRVDTAFEAVLDGCAAAQGPEREDTWINAPIRRLYAALFAQGFVHSVECWKDERLVGGLYGVSLGGAFFGESMFSRERDASKVALVHLVARLRKGGWTLLDAQFLTEHLSQFGAVETPQAAYLRRLKPALKVAVDETALIVPMTGAEAVDWALHPA
ncbi:leucyl/phenylalanyl-tRNA--protein transferase [Brevundimonas sp. TSRC1-1]|uniref:leucyl/phenylalanyl-tRNA--protein transferase n=1 Tax=Brevundimonas sp. TSRC1-1 TaxID=2804562 RepID=UPI003CF76AC0